MNKLQQKLDSREVAEMEKAKVVYLLKSVDDSVKIGVTEEFEKRLKVVQNQSGKVIDKCYVTGYCSNPFEIEAEFKRMYKDNRINGEWYSIDFEESKQILKRIFDAKRVIKTRQTNQESGIDKLLNFIFS
ncbi:GIY-YIG nuclease family protein [Mediterraneibacter gnavus]|uniref:GIY-YIG nuclease family protein n=1 Tax=Mediterraneibacter gnavus TaxID=33038 RepID=UPI00232FF8A7|nr:GIY-YIG nuclease family protein [Mediterraneibacter gnavus]MDB8711641.1 GIY-YIG nuclease family protein [Mediterraneibacter gnavus]MDB8714651.1 GIY-YIG nuclease family protein [Mediterraneibacter gnavus]